MDISPENIEPLLLGYDIDIYWKPNIYIMCNYILKSRLQNFCVSSDEAALRKLAI